MFSRKTHRTPKPSKTLCCCNLQALALALLLLPGRFTTQQLLEALCGLSYMSDMRMAFAEDANKARTRRRSRAAFLASLQDVCLTEGFLLCFFTPPVTACALLLQLWHWLSVDAQKSRVPAAAPPVSTRRRRQTGTPSAHAAGVHKLCAPLPQVRNIVHGSRDAFERLYSDRLHGTLAHAAELSQTQPQQWEQHSKSAESRAALISRLPMVRPVLRLNPKPLGCVCSRACAQQVTSGKDGRQREGIRV